AGILLINDGADSAIEVQVRPKDSLDCQFDAANGYYVLRNRKANGDPSGQRLLLKISRSGVPAHAATVKAPAAVPPRAPSVWKPRAAAADIEMTAMPLPSPQPAAMP